MEKDRPGPAFVALRAATLGIDDLSRQALREWVVRGIDHRGEPVPDSQPPPIEPGTVAIAAALMTLEPRDRAAYRTWVSKWTDHTGRVITPAEHTRRMEDIRIARERDQRKQGR